MYQGMDRPKVNTGDRVWIIFLSLDLAALKYPCPVMGNSPHLELSHSWGFEGGVEGLELTDLEGSPEQKTRASSPGTIHTQTDVLSLHPRRQYHKAGVKPPHRHLPLPNPCLESAAVSHRCHNGISQESSGLERIRSSSTLCLLRYFRVAAVVSLTTQGSPNQAFIALFQYNSNQSQHYMAGWAHMLLQQPVRRVSGHQ